YYIFPGFSYLFDSPWIFDDSCSARETIPDIDIVFLDIVLIIRIILGIVLIIPRIIVVIVGIGKSISALALPKAYDGESWQRCPPEACNPTIIPHRNTCIKDRNRHFAFNFRRAARTPNAENICYGEGGSAAATDCHRPFGHLSREDPFGHLSREDEDEHESHPQDVLNVNVEPMTTSCGSEPVVAPAEMMDMLRSIEETVKSSDRCCSNVQHSVSNFIKHTDNAKMYLKKSLEKSTGLEPWTKEERDALKEMKYTAKDVEDNAGREYIYYKELITEGGPIFPQGKDAPRVINEITSLNWLKPRINVENPRETR
uniref:RSN1_7TM domain-containing protein n=1 Tax=Steinernema glaseri TaxID=37863 RepID=A0A1I8AGQ9_9BILA